MKPSVATSLLLASLSLLDTSSATSAVADLPRFLSEKPVLLAELNAWKQSDAGQYAKQHGLIASASSSTMGVMTSVEDDQLRRLFLTKRHIEEVQRENPHAEFSIDSPFTLLTDDEFAAYVRKSFRRSTTGGFPGVAVSSVADAQAAAVNATLSAPLELVDTDWTTSGCVAPVKNQGQCGSCWAFAAVAALESAYCLKHDRTLTTFSEQHVLSCDTVSQGCDGGYPGDALDWIQKRSSGGRLCRESDYAYTSGTSGNAGQCQANPCATPVDVAIQRVAYVPESEAGLLQAVRTTPVAVGVAAGNRTWKQYKRGVVSTCASSELDHAVLVVGFSGASESEAESPFFKIKNSWGTAWGESGYIRLKRGVPGAGTCGVVGPKSVYPVLA